MFPPPFPKQMRWHPEELHGAASKQLNYSALPWFATQIGISEVTRICSPKIDTVLTLMPRASVHGKTTTQFCILQELGIVISLGKNMLAHINSVCVVLSCEITQPSTYSSDHLASLRHCHCLIILVSPPSWRTLGTFHFGTGWWAHWFSRVTGAEQPWLRSHSLTWYERQTVFQQGTVHKRIETMKRAQHINWWQRQWCCMEEETKRGNTAGTNGIHAPWADKFDGETKLQRKHCNNWMMSLVELPVMDTQSNG